MITQFRQLVIQSCPYVYLRGLYAMHMNILYDILINQRAKIQD